MNKLFVFAIVICIVFNSCTIQNRVYRKGQFIELSQSTANNHTVDNIITKKNVSKIRPEKRYFDFDTLGMNASVDVNVLTSIETSNSDTCDNLILTDGREISARVIEINPNDIRYRLCNSQTGEIFSLPKSDVFKITYYNGITEMIYKVSTTQNASKQPSEQDSPVIQKQSQTISQPISQEQTKSEVKTPKDTGKRKIEAVGIVGVPISVASWFTPFPLSIVLGVLAIILGIVSQTRISKHPDRLNGDAFGLASIIVGFACVVFLLFAIGSI